MKNAMILFSLLILFRMFGAVQVSAQEKSNIAVRGSQTNNGVVLLDVLKAGKTYQLQCNQDAPGCVSLKNGNYQMLELPKNFGLYDCRDVEVYPESVTVPEPTARDKNQKLGEYCLMGK